MLYIMKSWLTSLFGSRRQDGCRARAEGERRLVVEDGARHVLATFDLTQLKAIGVLQVGDDSTLVHEHWWWFEPIEGSAALVVSGECALLDGLLREGALRPAAEQVTHKIALFVADRPTALRGNRSVIPLDARAAADVRARATVRTVGSIDLLPTMG